MSASPTVWLLRAGHGAEHARAFADGGFVTIGWGRIPGLGDLRLHDEEEMIRLLWAANRGQPRADLGELLAFRDRLQAGDILVTPDTPARELLVGEITSDYRWSASPLVGDHRHWRTVRWLDRLALDDVPEPLVQTIRHYQRTVRELPDQDAWLALIAPGGTGDEPRIPIDPDRFATAVRYAAGVHAGQVRKGSTVPYLSHLLSVAALVMEAGGTMDEAIAALLHDAVEDQGGKPRLEDIRARFGQSVAELVDACTDYDVEGDRGPWTQRKRAYVAHIEHMDAAARRVSLADKLHNARCILRDYREIGDALWERFSAGGEAQLRYYRALADAFAEHEGGPLAAELEHTVAELERLAAP
jgi:hypothetical protein